MWYTLIYLFIGLILSNIWWKTEYEQSYNLAKKTTGVDDNIVVLLLLGFTIFWPFKLILNLFNKGNII